MLLDAGQGDDRRTLAQGRHQPVFTDRGHARVAALPDDLALRRFGEQPVLELKRVSEVDIFRSRGVQPQTGHLVRIGHDKLDARLFVLPDGRKGHGRRTLADRLNPAVFHRHHAPVAALPDDGALRGARKQVVAQLTVLPELQLYRLVLEVHVYGGRLLRVGHMDRHRIAPLQVDRAHRDAHRALAQRRNQSVFIDRGHARIAAFPGHGARLFLPVGDVVEQLVRTAQIDRKLMRLPGDAHADRVERIVHVNRQTGALAVVCAHGNAHLARAQAGDHAI